MPSYPGPDYAAWRQMCVCVWTSWTESLYESGTARSRTSDLQS